VVDIPVIESLLLLPTDKMSVAVQQEDFVVIHKVPGPAMVVLASQPPVEELAMAEGVQAPVVTAMLVPEVKAGFQSWDRGWDAPDEIGEAQCLTATAAPQELKPRWGHLAYLAIALCQGKGRSHAQAQGPAQQHCQAEAALMVVGLGLVCVVKLLQLQGCEAHTLEGPIACGWQEPHLWRACSCHLAGAVLQQQAPHLVTWVGASARGSCVLGDLVLQHTLLC
jgi:hypothetical protein